MNEPMMNPDDQFGGGMNNPQQEMGSDFGDGNDIENDEDIDVDNDVDNEDSSDPKKELQSLTGKLSEKIRKYNDEQENPDTELNKYIVGMIVKQAAKDMTEDEKKEIIKKLKQGFKDEEPNEDFGDGNENEEDEDFDDEKKFNENINRKTTKIIKEFIDDLMNGKNKTSNKIPKSKYNNNNPFISNR